MGDISFVERRRTWNASLREHFRDLEQRWNRANPPLVVRLPTPVASAPPPDLAAVGCPAEIARTIGTNRPNLILVGLPPNVTIVRRIVEQQATRPVVSLDRQLRTLAERRVGTLVIAEADRLNRQQQDQLHRWVTQHPLKQVIATASKPLFPLVVRNVFSAALFFQLNPTSLLIEAVSSELVRVDPNAMS